MFWHRLTRRLMFWPGAKDVAYIDACVSDFECALNSLQGHYVLFSEYDLLCGQWRPAYERMKSFWIPKWHFLYSKIKTFLYTYEHLEEVIETFNNAFVSAEISRCDGFLSNIDGKSLDIQQRTVVVTDALHNLVLAGAGSGKTLTIAGKVKYLCDVKNINPQDILLIAFTKKSAEEMTTRISVRLGLPVYATTFHKLGLDIITEAGKCPDVLDNLSDIVHNYFETTILKDSHAIQRLIEYFAYYLHIPTDMDKFDSLGEAYDYEKGHDYETIQSKYLQTNFVRDNAEKLSVQKRTLQNEVVKSLEEVLIANFLFLHGVRYEYERLYPYKSENDTYKPYHPDFYLPDYDIYIEHFGINKFGKLPWLPPIEEQKYLEGMKWKRQLHEKYETNLIETYSFYSSDGCLLEKLEQKLTAYGVTFKVPDFHDIFNVLYLKESDKYFSEFIELCCTFITLYKSNGYKLIDLSSLTNKNTKYKSSFYVCRTELFKSIIAPIMARYEEYLQQHNAVDFSDMINQASEIVSGAHEVHPYKWVIIDEFQDISVARYKLVDAILKKTGAKLLCVGDDWQSIYRFAGSDISLFTNFERYFGYTKVMKIEQTYRNSQQLIDEAGAFIMRNPLQMNKCLRSAKSLDYPIIFMCYRNNPFFMLQRTIRKIIQEYGDGASIMLLGRTQYDLELVKESNLFDVKSSDRIIFKEVPQTPIYFFTVHKAKGLEADNVVLLNFQNSILGFPNKISDDPLFELVLTHRDDYLYAEERRLFYVALTRTKNRIFILVDENKPSEFFREFEMSKSVYILSHKSACPEQIIKCPRCKTGDLMVRKNEAVNQYFVGCSNYPQCDYTVDNTSIMMDTKYCPNCGGFVVKRRGPYGEFYGCTNFPYCTHTE